MMQKGAANNIYMPSHAQQQAGFAQQAQLNHGYHTRSAAAHLAPNGFGNGGAGGGGGVANALNGHPGIAVASGGSFRGNSAPQSSSRPW